MSIDTWRPEVWSLRLRRFLDPLLVYAQPRVINRNWEGEIQDYGDTVHIRKFGDGADIRDYDPGTPMDPPDRPGEGGDLSLVIDQLKAFYVAIDDVDAVQADIALMDEYMRRTARNLAVVLDGFASARFVAGVLAANKIGGEGDLVDVDAGGSGDFTPYEFCVEARRLLQRQSTPGDDRWMIINADIEAQFRLDPTFITGGEGIQDASVVRSGAIGRIAGFDILTSEAASHEDNHTHVVFGDGNYSLTWADQIVKAEAERLQGEFGDAVKGLNVYGAKVVENESYGVAFVAGEGS